MVRDILMYMDRTYIMQQRRRPVYELGLHLFRITVWEHPRVQPRVTELLMSTIAKERAGELTAEGIPPLDELDALADAAHVVAPALHLVAGGESELIALDLACHVWARPLGRLAKRALPGRWLGLA